MSEQPITRDMWFAHSLGQTQELIGQQRQRLAAFIENAAAEDAPAHAAMYAEAADWLSEAWKAMGEAYEVMQNGDPEDYA